MSPLIPLLLRGLTWASVVLLAAFSLLDNGPSYALVWPWFFYAQLLWLGPWLWLAFSTYANQRITRFGPAIDTAWLVFAGAQLAAALTSPFRDASLAQLPAAVAPVALAYAIASWTHSAPARRETAIRALAFGSLLLCVASLFWWFIRDVLPALTSGQKALAAFSLRNLHPLGHWNYAAASALLGVVACGALALRTAGRARLGWSAATAVAFATFITAGSRGAWLGLGAGVAVIVLAEARHRAWPARRLALVAVLAALVCSGAALLHPRTRSLLAEFRQSRTLGAGDRQRFAMAEAGWRISRDHPWLGVGPGATSRVYPEYRSGLSGGVESALQLHNTPLQLAVDAGWPAAAAALLAITLLGWRAWRRAATEKTALVAVSSLAAYAVFSVTDYQLDVPWFATALGVLLGVAGSFTSDPVPASSPSDAPTPPAQLTRVRIALALLLVTPIAYSVSQRAAWSARGEYATAVEELFARQRRAYDEGYAAARELAPREPYFLNGHALLLLDPAIYYVPVSLGEPGERLAQARAALATSLELNPAQELVHFNLGWVDVQRDPAAAAQHFRAAAKLVPDKGGVYYGLGRARLAAGREADAIDAWALELVNDPAFVTSPVWCSPELRRFARPVRERAIARCREIAANAPASDRLNTARRARFVAAFFAWLDGDDAALPEVQREAEPLPLQMVRWIAGETPDPSIAPSLVLLLDRAVSAPDAAGTAQLLAAHYEENGKSPPPETLADLVQFVRTSPRRRLLLPDALTPRLIHQERRSRPAYGLLMKNLDGPTPRDLYLVQENRVVHDFLPFLFPDKGYLPGPVLAGEFARLAP